jgi:hypothetical protein
MPMFAGWQKMTTSGPHFNLNDDATVTVTFPTTPPVALVLRTEDIDSMLENLGKFRGAMEPPVPLNYVQTPTVQAVPDPAWHSYPEAMVGNSVIAVRDPRFGWLHYMLARENAKILGELLVRQAEMPLKPLGLAN